MTWFMAFLSPSVISLELTAATYVEMTFPPLAVLLLALSTHCPNLQRLAVAPHTERPGFMPAPLRRILKFTTANYTAEVEEHIKLGPGPSLACICPLVSFTISINILDRFCLDVISAWPLLESLELIMVPGQSFRLPKLAESAFPALAHLTLYEVPDFITFNSFWDAPPLVGKLTSVKLLSSAGVFANMNSLFLPNHTLISLLVDRSPHMQNLWLKVQDAGIARAALEVPVSVLDPLQRLSLHTLYLEGISLIGCENIPNCLATTFPMLRELGLPDHRITFADLRTYQAQMPQLRSLCHGVKLESLSRDLGPDISDIPRYRQSLFRTLQVNIFEPTWTIGLRERTSPCTYDEITLLVR
ncbi:hypothetical protein FS749_008539 [Ceratobasidium sp. UAMH 11750]|nr:hypothetical protein FS749_008539 [Ceratobasidium sp. UAMH 11750]